MTPTCRIRKAINTFSSACDERGLSKRSNYSNATTCATSAKMTFPLKLYNIIESESSDIISWVNNGEAFKIINHNRFESEIIPKYFRHSHISSVQRQLNLYGFRCVTRGAGDDSKGLFFHPSFKRGDIDHVAQIRRASVHSNHEQPPLEPKITYQDVSVFALQGSMYDVGGMIIDEFENEISTNLPEIPILEDSREMSVDMKPTINQYVPVNYTFKIRESMLANRLGYKNFAYAQKPAAMDIDQQKVLARSQLKRPLENVPVFENFCFDDSPRFNEGITDKIRKTKSFEDLLNFCSQLDNIPNFPPQVALSFL